MAEVSERRPGFGAAVLGALASAARGLEAFSFPQRCAGCGVPADPDSLLCPECLASIPRLSMSLCVRCLEREREPVGCLRHPGFTVWPAWVYEERAALVVEALKFRERPGLAQRLGAELGRVVPAEPAPDLVLEVPLHPSRHRERGYNQAALLADALSSQVAVPRLEGALERVRPTRPQVRLGSGSRRSNVAGAFRARRPGWLEGRKVLIVDDVMTTGATLHACLEVLAACGARAAGVVLAWAQ